MFSFRMKKILSIILVICMVTSNLSLSFAEGHATSSEILEEAVVEEMAESEVEEEEEIEEAEEEAESIDAETESTLEVALETEAIEDEVEEAEDAEVLNLDDDEITDDFVATISAISKEESIDSSVDYEIDNNGNSEIKKYGKDSIEEDIDQDDLDKKIIATTNNIVEEGYLKSDSKTITGVEILQYPTYSTYLKSDLIVINITGLKLRYTFDDGSYHDVGYGDPNTQWGYGGLSHRLDQPEVLGKHTVEVRCYTYDLEGLTNETNDFPVNIDLYVREVSDIEILDPPHKISYRGGEKLDLTGLEVRINYTDGYYEDLQKPEWGAWEYKILGSSNDNYVVSGGLSNVEGRHLLPYDNKIEISYYGVKTDFRITVSGTYTKWDWAECSYDEDTKVLTVLSSRFRPELEFILSSRNNCDITYGMKTDMLGGIDFTSYSETNLMIYNNVEKIIFDDGVRVKGTPYRINGVARKCFAATMEGLPKLKDVEFKNIKCEENAEFEKQVDSLYDLFQNCPLLENVDLSNIVYKIEDFSGCFAFCKNLKDIKIYSTYGKTFRNMFSGAAAPGDLDLSTLYVNDYDDVDLTGMFNDANIAGELKLGNFRCTKESCKTNNMFDGAKFRSIEIRYSDKFYNCGFKELPKARWRSEDTGDIFSSNDEMWAWHVANSIYANGTYSILSKLENVEIVNSPAKVDYTYGETFDLSGLRVKLSYSDGTEDVITYNNDNASHFKVYDMYKSRKTTVAYTKHYHIKYDDIVSSNNFCVNVNNVPDFTSVSDMQVAINLTTREDGTYKFVMGDSFTENLKKVMPLIIYKKDGASGYTYFYTYYSKMIDENLAPIDYEGVHSFNGPTGNVVAGDYEIDGYYKNLYYKLGMSVTAEGVVNSDILNYGLLNNLSIQSNPNKLNYVNGDTFNPDGLVLRLNNTNDCYKDIVYNDDTKDNFSFTPSISEALTEGTQHITITYYNKSVDLPINVSDPSNVKNVTFDIGHGIDDVLVQVAPNSHILKINDPETEGYTFEYWYETDENVAYDFDNSVVSDDVTLHAKWNELSYTLKYYEYNDGSGGWIHNTTKDSTRLYSESIGTLAEPDDRTGYAFLGWYGNNKLTGDSVTSIEANTARNIILYGKWEAKTYNIEFDLRGGTWKAGGPPYTDHIYNDRTKKVPTADMIDYDGHSLRGWYRIDPTTVPGEWDSWYGVNDDGSYMGLGQKPFYSYTGSILYAIYYDVYTISFDVNKYEGGVATDIGVATPENQKIINSTSGNKKITKPVIPSMPNYKFEGWYKENTYQTLWNFDDDATSNMTLYAKWTATPTQKFVFDNNGHGSAVSDAYVPEGGTLTNPGNLANVTGYTFKYWYEVDENVRYNFNTVISTVDANERTIHAKWEENKYIISYNLNGGSWVANYNTYPREILYTENVELPNSERLHKNGYNFDGWYLDNNFVSGPFSNATVNADNPKNLRYYAKWQPRPYTITYNKNGGDWVPGFTPTEERNYGVAVELPIAQNITKSVGGSTYLFDGWYTQDGTTSGSWGSKITSVAADSMSDVEVWAKWVPSYIVSFNVSYNYGGVTADIGATAIPSQNIVSGGKATTPDVPTVADENYIFEGWYKESTYVNKWNFSSDTIDAETTLYARWKVKATFNTGNTGSVYGHTGSTYAEYILPGSVNLPNAVPISTDGVRFAGWYGDESITDFIGIAGGSYVVNGPKVFYAKWEMKITYDENGHGTAPEAMWVQLNSSVVLPTLTNVEGYTFDTTNSWYENSNCEGTIAGQAGGSYTVTAPKTLYAKWTANTYNVSFNVGTSGATAPAQVSKTYGIANVLDLPLPTNIPDGYEFLGWYKEDTYVNQWTGKVANDDLTTENGVTVVVYAKWKTAVVFNINGHGTAQPSKDILGTLTFNLPNLTERGYTFGGWYSSATDFTDANFVGNAGESVTVSTPTTYYAKWTAKEYTINYNLNGGTITVDSWFTKTYDTAYASDLAVPAKTGYTFNGWFTTSALTTTYDKTNDDIYEEGTLTYTIYAKWTPKTYTINYNTNGGTITGATSFEKTYGTAYSGTLTTPTKVGYTFGGWFTTNALTTEYNKSNDGIYVEGTTSYEIFARWTPKTYTINYNVGAGASVSQAWFTKTYGTAITTDLAVPTKTGYTFDGWFTDNNAFDISYDKATDSIYVEGKTTPYNIYAKWTANTYNVSFNVGTSGATAPAQVSKTYGIANVLDLPLPTNIPDGYEFLGWYKEDTYVNQWTGKVANDDLTTENGVTVEVYAKWKRAIVFSVLYNGNNINATQPQSIDITSATSINLPNTSATGYTFGGWYRSATDFSDANRVGGYNNPVNVDSPTTFYAKWTPNVYTINYNTVLTDATIAHTYIDKTYGVNVTLDNPSREGYNFDGWYRNYTAATKTYSIPYDGTSDIISVNGGSTTIYAKWTAHTYTINYNTVISGATIAHTSTTKTYAINKTLDTPTKTNYAFVGWYKNYNETTHTYSDEYNGASDIISTSGGSTTIYAKWKAKIKYDANGHGVVPSAVDVDLWGAITLPTLTNVSGFSFDTTYSWYDNADISTATFIGRAEDNYIVTEPKTLYAKWVENEYLVSLHVNDGTFNAGYTDYAINPASNNYEKSRLYSRALTLPISDNISKVGYSFAGWYENAACTGTRIYSIPANTASNKEYWAKWNVNTYNVAFELNYGTLNGFSNPSTRHYGQSFTLPVDGEITRTGYTFEGWYDNGGFTGSDVTIVPEHTAESKTYYAKWEVAHYDITYNLDGGTLIGFANPGNRDYTEGFTLPTAADITKANHIFKGWYTEDGSATGIWDESKKMTSIPAYTVAPAGGHVFYARWNPSRTISFNVSTGDPDIVGDTGPTDISNVPTTQNVENGFKATKPTVNPTADGYQFIGWFTDNTFTTEFNFDNIVVTSDITIYAKWHQIQTITFNFDLGGHGTNFSQYVVENTKVIKPADPEIEGYTFIRWYEGVDSSVAFDFNQVVPSTSANPRTIKALWSENTYDVSFVLNSGTLTGFNNPSTRNYTHSFTLPTSAHITREGFTFGGWYENPTFDGSAVTSVAEYTAVDKTFYAKWNGIDYVITLHALGGVDPATGAALGSINYTSGHGTDLPMDYINNDLPVAGWYTEYDGPNDGSGTYSGTMYTNIGIDVYGNFDLYARYGVPITVTFNSGGGLGSMDNQRAYENIPFEISENEFTKNGYRFNGWRASNGQEYADKHVVTLTADTVLTALWVRDGSSGDRVTKSGSSGGSGGGGAIGGRFVLSNDIVTPITENAVLKPVNVKTVSSDITSWTFDIASNKFRLMLYIDGQRTQAPNGFITVDSVETQTINEITTQKKVQKTYYIDHSGNMLTGWLHTVDKKWYFMDNTKTNEEGNMAIGWKQIDGSWYYFALDGTMMVNFTTPDGYKVGADGRLVS